MLWIQKARGCAVMTCAYGVDKLSLVVDKNVYLDRAEAVFSLFADALRDVDEIQVNVNNFRFQHRQHHARRRQNV